ncbi:hypothetical protein [Salinicola sp. CR57]|uniref:hypothetical protein n=1 Tax=Salinicola sp. CR57 TaxID=1949086 RepID=UPI0013007A25|nr:hypothetical protein [Salinicola sp. CR57]
MPRHRTLENDAPKIAQAAHQAQPDAPAYPNDHRDRSAATHTPTPATGVAGVGFMPLAG